MSFMTSSWYMYTTQAYSSYSVYTRVRFVNARRCPRRLLIRHERRWHFFFLGTLFERSTRGPSAAANYGAAWGCSGSASRQAAGHRRARMHHATHPATAVPVHRLGAAMGGGPSKVAAPFCGRSSPVSADTKVTSQHSALWSQVAPYVGDEAQAPAMSAATCGASGRAGRFTAKVKDAP